MSNGLDSALVYLVVQDESLAGRLRGALEPAGYRVVATSALDRLCSLAAEQGKPVAVVVDMALGGAGAGDALAALRSECLQAPPVLFITPDDDVAVRLEAYRAGASATLSRPFTTEGLLRTLERISLALPRDPYRVLLVEGDEALLAEQAAVLRAAGMAVETESEPLSAPGRVEAFAPDVLVLAMEMPGVSGPELAALVRDRESHVGRPILFLTEQADPCQALLALNLGGDDFLYKPVEPALLVAAVSSRARRWREVQEAQSSLRQALYEKEREHQALNHHAIVSIADAQGRITYVNDRFCEVSGYERDELIGQNHRIIKSDLHPPTFYRQMWQTIARGHVWSGEVCNRRRDGELYWVESTVVPFMDEQGKPYQYVSIRTEITQVKQSESALRAIVQSSAFAGGSEFFDSSAEWLAKAMGVRIGFIAERDPNEPERLQMRSLWDGGVMREPFAYDIAATPCQWVYRKGLAAYVSGVAERFPEYQWLREHGVEGYVGLPLHDPQGKLLGHIGIMDDKPLHELNSKVDLLRIFASRVGGEIARRRSEQALKESDERLRRSQVFANIGTWDWDIRSGELFWSERIAPLFGYNEGELDTTYENFMGAIHPEDRDAVTAAVSACIEQGREYNIEHRVVWPDGQVRWVQEKGDVVRDAEGRPLRMLGVVMDIHERREAQQALEDSRQRLLEAQRLARLGNWEANLQSGELEWSEVVYDIFGLRQGVDSLSVERFLDMVHPADRPLLEASQRRAAQSGRQDLVHRILRPSGEVRYVHELANGVYDERGRLIGLMGTVQDVTELKRAEQELMIFRRIFDTAEQGIGVTDAEGYVLYANRAHDAIHGYAHGETLGKHFREFFSSETLAWAPQAINEAIAQGHGWSGLIPVQRPDGTEVITAANVGFVAADDGSPQYLFNILSDNTEEQQRQRQLAEAKEAAERASQAKSQFLSSMSHELRTPMNAILGFAQILEYDESLGGEQRDGVHEIVKAGNHLLSLINEVLDLSKIEAGHIDLSLEAVSLAEVVEECASLIAPVADRAGIALHYAKLEGFCLRADRTRLKQVLLNLLSNAIKYNRENGSVSLVASAQPEQRVCITVVDTGQGVSEEKLEQLFEPFNRVDAEGSEVEGTGIGLAITRRLVEMMGGSIGVESQPGKGSRFWIELPGESEVKTASKADAGPKTLATEQPPSAEYTVLYIEDNPVNLKLVSQLLGRRGHIHLLTAHEPQLGLELAAAHRPALILLDTNMPEMDGYQVLERLRAEPQLCDIPVVAVTANAMPRDIERGRAAGFDDYLTKPLNIPQFISTVERFLRAAPASDES
ncbi:MAG: PAS domain-containing protein [Pseudomonadota bacterium]